MRLQMCAVYALVVLVCSLLLPLPAGAQGGAAPSSAEIVEIRSVALRLVPAGAELTVSASAPPQWTLRNDDDGGFVLRLPSSRPTESVADLTFDDGLVAAVTVEARTDRGEATTFISVQPRERLRVSVRPLGTTLRVLLSSIGEVGSSYAVRSTVTECLNIRPAPNAQTRVDCLAPGTGLTLLSVSEGWGHVRLSDGRLGWTALRFLEATSTPSSQEEAVPEGATYVVRDIESCLNLRASLRTGPPVDCLATGTRVTLLELSPGWARVRVGDSLEGWAAREFLEVSSEIPTEATSEIPPEPANETPAEAEPRHEAEELTASLEKEWNLNSRLEARVAELEMAESEAESLRGGLEEARLQLEAAQEENIDLRAKLMESAAMLADSQANRTAPGDPQNQLRAAREELIRAEQEILRLESQLAETEGPGEVSSTSNGASGGSTEPAAQLTPSSAELEALAMSWAAAWAAQDVDDYLSFYSQHFTPEGGLGRETWEQRRRDRLARPSFIEVELSNLEVAFDDPAAPTVSFSQLYRSNTFTDSVRKSLVFAPENETWKIVRELSVAGP